MEGISVIDGEKSVLGGEWTDAWSLESIKCENVRKDDFALYLQYMLKWAAVLNGLLSVEWIGKNCILVCVLSVPKLWIWKPKWI